MTIGEIAFHGVQGQFIVLLLIDVELFFEDQGVVVVELECVGGIGE